MLSRGVATSTSQQNHEDLTNSTTTTVASAPHITTTTSESRPDDPVRDPASEQVQEQYDEDVAQKARDEAKENHLLNVKQQRSDAIRKFMPNPLAKHPPKSVPESPPKHVPTKYTFDVAHGTEENPALIPFPMQVGEEEEKDRTITYSVKPHHRRQYRLSLQNSAPFRDNEYDYDDRVYLTKKRMKVAERKVSLWKSAWHIARNFRLGPDLRSMIVPPELLKPMSNLEMFAVYSQPRNYLINITQYQSSLLRMQACLKWLLEAIVVIYRPQGLSHAKPLNPIRGEVFRCEWRHSDKSITTCVAECVSHYPEIDALYFENKTHNIVYEATIRPVVKRTKAYLCCKIIGEGRLHLLKTGEIYEIVFPNIDVRNVVFGKSYICPDGDVEILCQQTKLRTVFQIDSNTFKIHGKIVGDFRDGIICKISGNLQMDVHIKDYIARKRAQILNPARIREVPMKVARLSQQGHMESRRVWYPVCYALVKNFMNEAQQEKNKIEERQKQIVAKDPPNFVWKPKYFTNTEEIINDERQLPFYRFNRFHRPLLHQDELTIPWTGPFSKNDKLRRTVEVNPLIFAEDEKLHILEGPVRNLEEFNEPDAIDILEREIESDEEGKVSESIREQQEELLALEKEPFPLSELSPSISTGTPIMSPESTDNSGTSSTPTYTAGTPIVADGKSGPTSVAIPSLVSRVTSFSLTPSVSEEAPDSSCGGRHASKRPSILVASEDRIVAER
mmetsp:Transcript_4507/g.17046  ORF Transcript_4507/g.17046 Transcript_4507/m.17046 type:complete len:730 (-) Transcript_4507:2749-4938(-)